VSQPGPLSCPFFNEAGPDRTANANANAKGRVAMTVQMVEAKIKRESETFDVLVQV